jgi:hypothetical protein
MCKQYTHVHPEWNGSTRRRRRRPSRRERWGAGTPPHTRARSGHTHARTMAFILGGFSHIFAFKGAFQAEVRASSRETRRPPASWMTTTTTTAKATRRVRRLTNGMDDDDDAGGCG